MSDIESMGAEELGAAELEGTSGGMQSPFFYGIGYIFGRTARLIMNADPFDGNYYGVGA